MRLIYTKPKLKDLSQGSRLAFVRQFRFMSQDDVSDKLGLTGECKRRTMTRYEKENRNPKEKRLEEFDDIFSVNINTIKKYDFNNPVDIIYTFMWMEELIPNFTIDLSKVPRINNDYMELIKRTISEWDLMRVKRIRKEISYEEYINWKLCYEIKEIK